MQIRLLIPFLFTPLCFASTSLLIIGGGPNPNNSQFSIESNVEWFYQIASNASFSKIDVLFGSGNNHEFEVSYHDSATYTASPLAIVFNQRLNEKLRFRATQFSSQEILAADKKNTLQFLESHIKTADKNILLLFSGHGGKNETADNNHLHLWNDEKLDVKTIHKSLENLNPESKFRFILPQCFSGGFTKLAYRTLKSNSDVSGNICGFTSVSKWDYAEGCTASVNTSDYQDYASKLIESITGKDRNSKPTPKASDIDNDGKISLYEAHLHSIAMTNSADIPRSTSESFLLDTESWVDRWQSVRFHKSSNQFSKTLEKMTAGFNYEIGTLSFNNELNDRLRTALERVSEASDLEYANMDARIVLQQDIREDLYIEWPQLQNPMTSSYHQVLNESIEPINSWISAHPKFLELKNLESQADELSQRWVKANRNLAKLKRMKRLLKLSRLFESLMAEDSQTTRQYQSLLECESWTPPFAEN